MSEGADCIHPSLQSSVCKMSGSVAQNKCAADLTPGLTRNHFSQGLVSLSWVRATVTSRHQGCLLFTNLKVSHGGMRTMLSVCHLHPPSILLLQDSLDWKSTLIHQFIVISIETSALYSCPICSVENFSSRHQLCGKPLMTAFLFGLKPQLSTEIALLHSPFCNSNRTRRSFMSTLVWGREIDTVITVLSFRLDHYLETNTLSLIDLASHSRTRAC